MVSTVYDMACAWQQGLIEAMSNPVKPTKIIVCFVLLLYHVFQFDKEKRTSYIPAKIELWPGGVVQG